MVAHHQCEAVAALEAAECGKQVILVEKNPSVGCRVSQLYKYFPKLCHPKCGMEINLRRLKANKNIRLMTMTEVSHVEGDSGNYTVTLKATPRYVNENCTACGACGDAVETEFDSEYDYGLGKRKGAYLPFNMAYPQRYVLDPRMIGTGDAQKAKDACKYDAIDLDMQESETTITVGAIIWATGWQPFDADKIQPYGHDRIANVVSSVEFERMLDPFGPTGGKILRPSNGEPPKHVAFVQCAGSRDPDHLAYCSSECCLTSLRQVSAIHDLAPGVETTVVYRDMRTPGQTEHFYLAVQEHPMSFLARGEVEV